MEETELQIHLGSLDHGVWLGKLAHWLLPVGPEDSNSRAEMRAHENHGDEKYSWINLRERTLPVHTYLIPPRL